MEKRKEKKGKREDFNYVSKGMLKFIIRNVEFWNGYILAMNSHFFQLSESNIF